MALDTDEGVTGWGECYNHGPDRALEPMLEYLFTFIQGRDPRRIEFIIQYLMQQSRFPPGRYAGCDIGHRSLPLGYLREGARRSGLHAARRKGAGPVRVYAGVYTAPDAPAAKEELDRLNEGWGFTAFKLSPYRLNIYQNRWGEVVRTSASISARCARPFGRLRDRLRCPCSHLEPHQAVQLGNALAPYDPLFFEEPIRPENVEAWGDMKRQMACTLATGESLYSRFEFLRLLTVRGADIIQPDICVVGGLLEMRKIAAIAEAHYVTVAPHNPMGPLATAVNLHFSAAQPNFRILEYRFPNGRVISTRAEVASSQRRRVPVRRAWYVKDPYLPRDGYLELRPDRPGWGVEMDEEVFKTDDYVHWERRVGVRPDGSTAFP